MIFQVGRPEKTFLSGKAEKGRGQPAEVPARIFLTPLAARFRFPTAGGVEVSVICLVRHNRFRKGSDRLGLDFFLFGIIL